MGRGQVAARGGQEGRDGEDVGGAEGGRPGLAVEAVLGTSGEGGGNVDVSFFCLVDLVSCWHDLTMYLVLEFCWIPGSVFELVMADILAGLMLYRTSSPRGLIGLGDIFDISTAFQICAAEYCTVEHGMTRRIRLKRLNW